MQRRGGSGQPVKGQSANRPKARNAPTAQVSTADLQEQLDRVIHERDEALEQQAATLEWTYSRGTLGRPCRCAAACANSLSAEQILLRRARLGLLSVSFDNLANETLN